MNSLLYFATVMIWGTTWIALAWQAGSVAAVVSVFYRFAIAAIVFMPILVALGKLQRVSLRDHGFFMLQGACLFSTNFICFYHASYYIISGLLAVVFAMASIFNALNQWLFWKKKPKRAVFIAAIFGIVGLVLLFWQQLQLSRELDKTLLGIVLCVVGTYCFSLGNMVSVRHSQQGIRPATGNAYGMIYGALILLVVVALSGAEFSWDQRAVYWIGLLYLSVIGSIVGFTVYLALVARIGANEAAYTTVVFPVVALMISTFLEGYQWTKLSVTGLVLVLLGVLISSRSDVFIKIYRELYRLCFAKRMV